MRTAFAVFVVLATAPASLADPRPAGLRPGATALQSKSGHFTAFDGTFEMPSDDPKEAKVRVAVDVGSVTTSIGLLARHLKGEDFFDVDQYPWAEFASEAVAPGPEPGVYQVAGQLQLHGVTRRVECPARISVTPDEVAFDGMMTVRQSEFGMDEGARKAKDEVPVQVSFRGR
ncbi:YceI family protein [Singulisphaera acidiphila]|uniref:Lipid/polyisoprenoid-binding YceI-like domain-containing protein n=1 Tax=Singulisphaera acidiphila (strain ATCC BAA-1392 / DSM 18658 / VKM B-2454 / MOB10) TaxID=886293 RepID=L0DNH5_SINAD|nr:YceI family protein [Singulisphaera acidiphila]AGA30383.1 hypothetical protein Sinac_6296 [Singulisphaera acidiphila DSM 18658]